MDRDNSFWGEEWKENLENLQEVNSLKGLERLVEDRDIILGLGELKKENPDLFKKIKFEVVPANKIKPDSQDIKYALLVNTPAFFSLDPDNKNSTDPTSEPQPTVVISERELKINREGRKVSIQAVAELFGLEAEDLSDRFMKLFILLHEVGHGVGYMNDYAAGLSPAEASKKWSEDYWQQLETLPLPGIMPSAANAIFEDSFGEPDQFLKHCVVFLAKYRPKFITDREQYRKDFFARLNGKTLEDLLVENEKAYRQLPHEHQADSFAADFMKAKRDVLGIKELEKND